MGIHPQGDRFVAVSQNLAHAGHIGSIGDGETGEGVPLRYNYDKPEKPRISRLNSDKVLFNAY